MNYHPPIEHISPTLAPPGLDMVLPFRAVAFGSTGLDSFICDFIALFCKGGGTFKTITIVTSRTKSKCFDELKSKGIIILPHVNKLPPLQQFDEKEPHLIVFDYNTWHPHHMNQVTDYFIRGRYHNVSVLGVSFNYFAVDSMIRGISNYLFAFSSSPRRDNDLMLKDRPDIKREQLVRMLRFATYDAATGNNGVLTIEKDTVGMNFKKNFLESLDPDAFLTKEEDKTMKQRIREGTETLASVIFMLRFRQRYASIEYRTESATKEIEQYADTVGKEQIRECCVCCEDTPVYLECGHPTCFQCIKAMIKMKAPYKHPPCPVCRVTMGYKEPCVKPFQTIVELINYRTTSIDA
jgi:hypothetical protein